MATTELQSPDWVPEAAQFMLTHMLQRVNNVPTALDNRVGNALVNTSVISRDALKRVHTQMLGHVHASKHSRHRKCSEWMGPSNALFTEFMSGSYNGGISCFTHFANAWALAHWMGRVGGLATVPTNVTGRDMSVSATLPINLDTDTLVATAPGRWFIDRETFAGAVGVPEAWQAEGNQGSVTLYSSGKIVMSGCLPLSGFGRLLYMVVDLCRPFSAGVSPTGLQELILCQKQSLIFDATGTRVPCFARNTVALMCPRPDTPVRPLPGLSRATLDTWRAAAPTVTSALAGAVHKTTTASKKRSADGEVCKKPHKRRAAVERVAAKVSTRGAPPSIINFGCLRKTGARGKVVVMPPAAVRNATVANILRAAGKHKLANVVCPETTPKRAAVAALIQPPGVPPSQLWTVNVQVPFASLVPGTFCIGKHAAVSAPGIQQGPGWAPGPFSSEIHVQVTPMEHYACVHLKIGEQIEATSLEKLPLKIQHAVIAAVTAVTNMRNKPAAILALGPWVVPRVVAEDEPCACAAKK
jgi:hypothetical protein